MRNWFRKQKAQMLAADKISQHKGSIVAYRIDREARVGPRVD